MVLGIVYSCGHGHGGRLGLGTKHTELIPRQIKFAHNIPAGEIILIKTCCIARDHSLFLSSNGMVNLTLYIAININCN